MIETTIVRPTATAAPDPANILRAYTPANGHSAESLILPDLLGHAFRAPHTTTLRKLAILGNHLPRQCGIATFTTDLSEAIGAEFPVLDRFVLAMNDAGRRHAYPAGVRFQIGAAEIESYRSAADFLNASDADVLSVQHEYGIFGGSAGSHVFALLRDVRVPIVTTLHTILTSPDAAQRLAMDELTQISERLIVMSAHGAQLLRGVHGVPDHKIDFIPHGIPRLPDAAESKRLLGVEGKTVILTFGLLSPDKGIENVIDALPAIRARHPETIYIVLGATHPHVKEHHGEAYRTLLQDRARRLGVDSGMIFHDEFVSHETLTRYLAAADIYITPYLNPEQITSGTLAYAVGSGKAVISTPYAYARELLDGGCGILVPWPRDDPHAIAREVIGLLNDHGKRRALCARAAAYGRGMRWPDVARSYVRSFERARADRSDRLRAASRSAAPAARPLDLPEINLEHVGRLSDHTGILQHAAFNIPRNEDGYCLDDNARALLLTARLEDSVVKDVRAVRALASRYLAFVSHAFDARSGRFKNFMSYSRQWLDECGSEDCHGRALWALGAVVGRSNDAGHRGLAESLFQSALPAALRFTSPRAWAYALLGIDECLNAPSGERAVRAVAARELLAGRLFDLYRRSSSPEWPWFEERATYCNARLPEALLVSGHAMRREEITSVGLESLTWLAASQRAPHGDGCFAPIGSNGFHQKGGARASFDQQPVEAGSMVSACLAARQITGDEQWGIEARRAFDWFLGHNQLQRSLYDASTGGCRDGLHADRPNENQGAESTLSFLLALVAMRNSKSSTWKNTT